MYNITIAQIIASVFFSDKHPENLAPTRQRAPTTAPDCIFLVLSSESPLGLPVQRAAEHRDLWVCSGLEPSSPLQGMRVHSSSINRDNDATSHGCAKH